MFAKKNSGRHLLNILLEFDLDAISDWLKHDTDVIPALERHKWSCPTLQQYRITIIPNGEDRDYYYHENINQFSESLAGKQTLAEVQHPQLHMANFCKRNGIEDLEWEIWRDCLGIAVNRRSIMLAPLNEAVALMKTRETSYKETLRPSEETVDIPIAFDENGVQREHIVIHRFIYKYGVTYSNQLASVSYSVPTGEVCYDG